MEQKHLDILSQFNNRTRNTHNIVENITVNEYYDQVYVLNLERRKDRLLTVTDKLNKLNINFKLFSAIDGSVLHYVSKMIKDNLVFRTPNYLACTLSHLSILNDAQVNGYEKILVLEDDIDFDEDDRGFWVCHCIGHVHGNNSVSIVRSDSASSWTGNCHSHRPRLLEPQKHSKLIHKHVPNTANAFKINGLGWIRLKIFSQTHDKIIDSASFNVRAGIPNFFK